MRLGVRHMFLTNPEQIGSLTRSKLQFHLDAHGQIVGPTLSSNPQVSTKCSCPYDASDPVV